MNKLINTKNIIKYAGAGLLALSVGINFAHSFIGGHNKKSSYVKPIAKSSKREVSIKKSPVSNNLNWNGIYQNGNFTPQEQLERDVVASIDAELAINNPVGYYQNGFFTSREQLERNVIASIDDELTAKNPANYYQNDSLNSQEQLEKDIIASIEAEMEYMGRSR